ncbi:ATP-binding cassette domain-containing protein [Yinghuangia aomiensis]
MCAPPTAASPSCTASTSPWNPAGSWPSSAPTAPGKTTTLRVAAGVHPRRPGACSSAAGTSPAPRRATSRAPACALIPEGRGVFPNLSVRDNLWMMTCTGRGRDEVEAIAYDRFPILGKRRSQAAGTLSGGEQQMLALARGLRHRPCRAAARRTVHGTGPLVVARLYELVAGIAAQGVAVLVVEQFATAVLGIADHAAVLVRGRVAWQGSPDGRLRDELSAASTWGARYEPHPRDAARESLKNGRPPGQPRRHPRRPCSCANSPT